MHTPEERFYTAITVAAIVLGIIIIYFITSMIRHQRRNVQLYRAKIKAEISTLENERRRIATDLHDELGPLLSAVRIRINHLSSESDNDRNIVSYANKHIDDILTKAREISYNLLPNTLVRKGLVKAIEEYISKLREVHDLKIIFRADTSTTLDKEKEINIYRIIQEVIHNTVKHAKAKQLIVELKEQGDQLILITADDGKGFNIGDKMSNSNGLGLINLQSRAEILNAKFSYDSEPDKGTRYIFEMPLIEVL
jgi:two-component system NarL family sensor kinase